MYSIPGSSGALQFPVYVYLLNRFKPPDPAISDFKVSLNIETKLLFNVLIRAKFEIKDFVACLQ